MQSSKDRIKKAYSTELFSQTGKDFISNTTAYLDECYAKPQPVFPKETGSDLFAKAAASLKSGGRGDLIGKFSQLTRQFLDNAQRIHSPHYMGHQVPPPLPVAGLFDGIASTTNQGLAVSEMGPFSMAIERAVIRELGDLIGWGSSFDGIATGGGTVANLTALLAARNKRYPGAWEKGIPQNKRPAIITSAESHYSVSRAAGVLGIGTEQVIKAPLDKMRRLDVALLPSVIEKAEKDGLDVFCIVASLPSTPIGAFDEIGKIAKIANEAGIWCHADGAHGASVLFSQTHKHLVAGIELADSVTWDAHKLLFVPSLSTYLLFKNEADSWKSFKQDAPYLFDKTDDGQMRRDGGLRTIECTKRGLSVALWGVWSLFGKEIFSDLIDLTFANTTEFYEMLKKDSDFEVLHRPEANIICFRHRATDDQIALRKKLQENGDFYITATKLDGKSALRLTLMNPLTERKHLEALLSAIKAITKR